MNLPFVSINPIMFSWCTQIALIVTCDVIMQTGQLTKDLDCRMIQHLIIPIKYNMIVDTRYNAEYLPVHDFTLLLTFAQYY